MKRRKVGSIIILILLIITITTIVSLYIKNQNFRDWIDFNIFRKSITEKDTSSIDLNSDKLNQIHVYNRYVAVLNNQKMTLYNNFGEELNNMDVNISSAIFDSNEKYLCIAEDGGGEIYLILDKNYLWSNKLEGKIQQICVNRNGYVAVITEDTTYKSILNIFNSDGVQVFRSFFAQTEIVDVSISDDNKYIAVGEVDTTGAVIQSNVKILSVENAKNNPDNAIIYTHNAESGKLITNVKYQGKNQVLCMYNDEIDLIKDKENKKVLEIENRQISFMSVNLNNNVVFVEEPNTGVLKTNTQINFLNAQKPSDINKYDLNEMIKDLYAKDNVVAINTGNEMYFFNAYGKLLKKYASKQEITNICFSNYLVALIYKDKIILINL